MNLDTTIPSLKALNTLTFDTVRSSLEKTRNEALRERCRCYYQQATTPFKGQVAYLYSYMSNDDPPHAN